jgi:2-hydroxymuconate-semialdehyde hydrolase
MTLGARFFLVGLVFMLSRNVRGAERARLTWYRDVLKSEGVLRDIEVDGYKYCVADVGGRDRKPTIVLLHGVSGSIYDWRHLLKPLARTHRVVAIDMLGAGESDKPGNADYSLPAQARRVRGILDALSVEKSIVIGNSYGGGVALIFAQYWPERVDRLVLINSICYADHVPGYLPLSRMPGAVPAAQILPAEGMTRFVVRNFSSALRNLKDEEIDTYLAELAPSDRRRSLIETLRAIVPEDLREFERRIRSIQAPSLLIWGKLDHTVPIELGRRLAKELPHATLVEIDDAGHLPNQEAPDQVLKAVGEFLR